MSVAPAATAASSHPRAVSLEVTESRILSRLRALYSEEVAQETLPRVMAIVKSRKRAPRDLTLTEADVLLISYADHVQEPGITPLKTLNSFVTKEFDGLVNIVHVLPFYPDSGDGGFAVSDYSEVKKEFGTWDDIAELSKGRRVMFDCVLNHASKDHRWFQAMLAGDKKYESYFLYEDDNFDISNVVRPRATPLFTEFQTVNGPRKVWTTFGEEQVDLNFHSPELLLEIVNIVITYVERGADILRTDATHFMWKESGTTCVNLDQAHSIIKMLRDVLDAIDPSVIIINETNVPHAENITYFGNGQDEAQLVYNFALPSLLVNTMQTANAEVLTKWASTLTTPSEETFFLNYGAVHDGISLRGSSQILDPKEWNEMVERSTKWGGRILYRATSEGDHPYEMCITYFDAVSAPTDPMDSRIARFITSQAIIMAMKGMPAIYFASMFGASTVPPEFEGAGHPRDGVREKYDAAALAKDLADTTTRTGKVFAAMSNLLKTRRSESAFHPNAAQKVFNADNGVFAIERMSLDGSSRVLAIHNVTDQVVSLDTLIGSIPASSMDLLTGQIMDQVTKIEPYQVLWLKAL